MKDNKELKGELVSCYAGGEEHVGIVLDVNSTYISLVKCGIWERHKLYFKYEGVTIRISLDSSPVLHIYENFKEVKD